MYKHSCLGPLKLNCDVTFYSGPATLTSRSQLSKDELFEGEENPFVYSRYYELTFNCEFQFANYPFDFQKCYIEVS